MEIHAINSPADFEEGLALINAMGKWDAEESRKFGVPDAVLFEYIYGHTAETLMEKFGQRGAGFFLARADKHVAGCVGYSKSDDSVAELQKMYVRPASRGQGVAKGLMTACLDAMRDDGYANVRLETVTFMSDAIALYDAFGFKRSEQFRTVPLSLQPITIFMARKL
ncbi:acetyltransferase [Rhizobium leguminosarum bv. trifolii WSM2297]|uniref:Acetyltransferase n=1 Tax=Rhizobium leguminosarum bv. trifolii WSM2297 TaxID=754762 RepID=J0KUN1_RHILT|nr:GNAT family N-acetyltransferase [Rhizobium leguminosarum]EJC81384.1 acetyltransferase [Rhizobium leguminosarum bv. trifolii WSM2297]